MILRKKLNTALTNISYLLNSPSFFETYELMVKEIVNRLKQGGRIYIAGNGGSASDAQHLAAEFVCKIDKERPGIAAEALTTDTSLLTAIANDFGYEYVFSRQLETKCTYKDVFIGISTSGNSKNIIEAFKKCNGLKILFTGKNTGQAASLCDIVISVQGNTTDQIQELHEIIYHSIVYDVENLLFGE